MGKKLVSAIKIGLIGGVATWHLCLVGMFETFAERYLIGETITMGYIMLIALVLLVGGLAGRREQQPALAVGAGSIAGSLVGLALALLAILAYATSLNKIFPFASANLVDLLSFGSGMEDGITGLVLLVAGGLVAGAAGGVLSILPQSWRHTVTLALIVTILVALLRDVIAVLLPEGIQKFFFTSSGLTLSGMGIILVVTGAFAQAQIYVKRQQAQRATEIALPQRSWLSWVGLVLFSIFVLVFPIWSKSFLGNVADFVGLYIIMGLGLNLVIGFAGMLDLGFVAFYAIGAYTMAIFTSPEMGPALFGTPAGEGLLTFWQALPFSMLFALLGGTILALPILKMRGDYLAIATLGFGEIIRILVLSDFLKPYLGGAQGITRIARPEIGGMIIKDPEQFYYLILAGVLIAWFITSRLKHSRMGRAWMAVREDEDVAQAMGINRVVIKLWAFVIGAFLGGMSGGIFASMLGSVVPKSFELLISINVLALIIVGGMGSLPGIVVGAIVMVGMPELLREFREYRMLVYGVVLVAMMLYRPEGLWPETVVAREMAERKEREQAERERDVAPA